MCRHCRGCRSESRCHQLGCPRSSPSHSRQPQHRHRLCSSARLVTRGCGSRTAARTQSRAGSAHRIDGTRSDHARPDLPEEALTADGSSRAPMTAVPPELAKQLARSSTHRSPSNSGTCRPTRPDLGHANRNGGTRRPMRTLRTATRPSLRDGPRRAGRAAMRCSRSSTVVAICVGPTDSVRSGFRRGPSTVSSMWLHCSHERSYFQVRGGDPRAEEWSQQVHRPRRGR